MPNVSSTDQGRVRIVEIDRPETRNAIDDQTAEELADAFERFDTDDTVDIGVLTGADGTFCSGADLGSVADGELIGRLADGGRSPLGPVRMRLSKPVIAAIEGHAVAGGLELALWCDLRVAARDAVLGVFSRRFGVPLVDMGTIRLPRLIGHGRAMDLVLTGRGVGAIEALEIGLVSRLADPGQALTVAVDLAKQLTGFPQVCMRNDRMSVIEQWSLTEEEAMRNETRLGLATVASGEPQQGAEAFTQGRGRHGRPVAP